MSSEDKERFEVWKKTTLSDITTVLRELSEGEEIRSRIAVFGAFVTVLGRKAYDDFMLIFGFTSQAQVDAMDNDSRTAYSELLVLAMNSGLRHDYPFIAALIFSDETPLFRACAVERRAIPGAHDLSRTTVPIIHLKNAALGEKNEFRLKDVKVEYFGKGDNLEELYKL